MQLDLAAVIVIVMVVMIVVVVMVMMPVLMIMVVVTFGAMSMTLDPHFAMAAAAGIAHQTTSTFLILNVSSPPGRRSVAPHCGQASNRCSTGTMV